jgi:hypothetical protein
VIANTKDVDALFWMAPPLINVSSLKDLYQAVTLAGIATTAISFSQFIERKFK